MKNIFNIALVPDDEHLHKKIVLLSKQLNKRLSSYFLRLPTEPFTVGSSLAHCTLMHFKSDENIYQNEQFLKSIKPLLESKLEIKSNGLKFVEVNAFVKSDLINNKETRHRNLVLSLETVKSRGILALQEEVIEALTPFADCITGIGPEYTPHFTQWVMEKGSVSKEEVESILRDSYEPDIQSKIKCKLILGNCGNIGQIEYIILN